MIYENNYQYMEVRMSQPIFQHEKPFSLNISLNITLILNNVPMTISD